MSLPEALQPFAIEIPGNPVRRFGGVSQDTVTYLRFADQAAQDAAFAAAGIVATEGETLPPDFHWPSLGDVSIVGLIVDEPAVMGPDEENGFPTIVTPATYLPGWHVNILPMS